MLKLTLKWFKETEYKRRNCFFVFPFYKGETKEQKGGGPPPMHAGKKENTLASLALLHITSECYIYVCVTGDTGIYCSRQRILVPEITSIIRSFFTICSWKYSPTLHL
jgi:hypothetical protein